jgi:two-component system chemotaxis response regulator CheY
MGPGTATGGRFTNDGGSGMNRTILLVDEWRAVRLLGRRALSSLGFQTREARSAREALEIVRSDPQLAAVLLEWRPDDADCPGLWKQLADRPRQSRPIVIACSDTLDRVEIVAAIAAGADDFLQKPFCREAMREKFERLGLLTAPDAPCAGSATSESLRT